MIEQDNSVAYFQLTLFSFLCSDTQIAADVFRVMLGDDPFEYRSLLAFDYVRHEESHWSLEFDLLYFKFEYDSEYGWQ